MTVARTRWHASIHVKLIALTAVLIAAIVGGLATYFSTSQIRALRTERLARVEAYAAMLSQQLASAVAFSDRETAREVLASSSVDHDLVWVALYDEDGHLIYGQGVPPVGLDNRYAPRSRIVDLEDRIVMTAPVVSVEGPHGSLVMALSTARFDAREDHVMWTAIGVGAGALAFGVLASWLIARSLVRRLRAIREVASAIANGSSAHTEVAIDAADEIGRLAGVFNTMLVRLSADQAQLESRVEQRTAELQTEMKHRSEIEVELRQAQKLESVGRLAAGIAHEINTPVQFVADSCSFLQLATTDVLKLIADYRGIVSALGDPAAVERAQELEEEIELSYVEQQIPQATSRALQGLGRVSDIVRAMKEFAYPDRSEQAAADLNRAIESTLLVARNEYKYVADVVTELAELPLVMCHVGELNQVVLNIVVNAAHAIESANRGTEKRGTIKVATRAHDDAIEITISDDGCGIPREHLDKIFDPFFTTKEIGKGTGQGLAIARSVVVDKHAGRLTVDSVIGQGTTFTIQLPLTGAQEKAA